MYRGVIFLSKSAKGELRLLILSKLKSYLVSIPCKLYSMLLLEQVMSAFFLFVINNKSPDV